jgi:pyrophosphatase PpaX
MILKERKYKIGLFTLENRKITNYILKKFSIIPYFNSIITRDDVNNPKPHPDHLKLALDQLKVTSDKIIVVGDNPIDFECAKQLNALTVALLNDRHTKDELLNSGANYTIENLLDILQIIEAIDN